MKYCPKCGAAADGQNSYCDQCGTFLGDTQEAPNQVAPEPTYESSFRDPYDHTEEFTKKDISDNKIFAAVCYMLGTVGVIIGLLAGRESRYVMFHVRQALKISVASILLLCVTALLFWTVLVPLAGAVMMIVLLVLRIICLFQVFNGKAKEPAIIRNLGFMR